MTRSPPSHVSLQRVALGVVRVKLLAAANAIGATASSRQGGESLAEDGGSFAISLGTPVAVDAQGHTWVRITHTARNRADVHSCSDHLSGRKVAKRLGCQLDCELLSRSLGTH